MIESNGSMRLRILICFLMLASHIAVARPCRAQEQVSHDVLLEFAMRYEGDIEKGRELFTARASLGCTQCHSIDGSRRQIGPDLFAIGDKFARREIIESILNPSQRIADGYETTVLETLDGRQFTGIVRQVTDHDLELRRSSEQIDRVPLADIETRQFIKTSIMPHGLSANLSLQEFSDLIEFLVSLKQPETSQQLSRGMPYPIAEIKVPVHFEPMISTDLRFDHPAWLGSLPGQNNSFLVSEHLARRIWRIEKTRDAVGYRKTIFLDLGPLPTGEGRLVCLAAHPRFRENGRYFLFDRVQEGNQIHVHIHERRVTRDRRTDSGQPSRTILKVPQTTGAHFGGWLEFGPDRLLYISCGDSGPQEDPQGNSQNRQLLLGKLLRIDVDRTSRGRPYAIPADNPFAHRSDTRPEIWALGFRAPWRFSFDRVTGDLWVGDVGQDRYEEVSIVRRGENHGWNVYEGFVPFSNQYRRTNEEYVSPVFAYARRYGPSVTGGFVYRGDVRSSFYGAYICGDFESRRVFAVAQKDRTLQYVRQIGEAPERIVSFGRDENNQLYVVGYEGMIYRINLAGSKFE